LLFFCLQVPSDSFNASVSNADGSIVLPVPLIGSSGIGASAFVASAFNLNVSWSNGTGGPVQLNVNYSNGFSVTTTLQVCGFCFSQSFLSMYSKILRNSRLMPRPTRLRSGIVRNSTRSACPTSPARLCLRTVVSPFGRDVNNSPW
jgi:hypothetical protein